MITKVSSCNTFRDAYNMSISAWCTTTVLKFLWRKNSINTKRWWNETYDESLPVFANFFWTLWNLFSLVPKENCFRRYIWQLFVSLALRECKKDCKILKIILVPDVFPLRTEIALDFLSDFVFNFNLFQCTVLERSRVFAFTALNVCIP